MRILPARSIWVPPTSTVFAVTDIFLDRGREPWRRHFKIDRACAKPPPQRAKASGEDDQQNSDDDREPLHPSFAHQPLPQRVETVSEPVKAEVRSRQQAARAMAGLLMVVIPAGIIPLRKLVVDALISTLGAAYLLPLPLGAGADCTIDRCRLALRIISSAPLPASLPILG